MVGEPFIEEFIEGEDPDAALVAGYPRLLALRDAASYEQLIRDALGNQAIEAQPVNLWQADETAGVVVDLIGNADLTAFNGATRALTDVGSGDLDGAMVIADSTSQYWRVANPAALVFPNGESFAVIAVADIPAVVGASQFLIAQGKAVPLGFLCSRLIAGGSIQFVWNDGTINGFVTCAADHIDQGRFVYIFGVNATEEEAYCTSSLNDPAPSVFDLDTILENGGHFLVGAIDSAEDGGLATATGQTDTHLAVFKGADAEVILANRAALAARLLAL